MKVDVCDICLKKNELILSEEQVKMEHCGQEFKINFCEKCKDRIPKGKAEFIAFYCWLCGVEVSMERVKEILRFQLNNKLLEVI